MDCDRPLSAEPSTQPPQNLLYRKPWLVPPARLATCRLCLVAWGGWDRTTAQGLLASMPSAGPANLWGLDVEARWVDTSLWVPAWVSAGQSLSCLGFEAWTWDSSASGPFYMVNFCLKTERHQRAPGNSRLQLPGTCGSGLPATTGAAQPGGPRLRQLVHSHVLPAGQASALLLLEGSVGASGPGGTGGGPAAMDSRGYGLPGFSRRRAA